MKPFNSIFRHSIVLLITLFTILSINPTQAQSQVSKLVQKKTDLKFFGAAQIWLRHTDLNPGSTIQGTPKDYVTEISIRRFRIGVAGRPADNLFVKFQMGTNNLNYLSSTGYLRILDLEAFYTFSKYLTVGGGKTGYIGLSRYSGPASASVLGFDLPFFAMTTVGITDEILRRPSIAAKGDLGKLNYRVVIARQQKITRTYELTEDASFQQTYQEPQYSAYIKYQFFDKDKDTSAFLTETYYGTKKILNIGVGFEYQQDALCSLSGVDTIRHDMLHFAADIFIDMPLNASNTKSFTFYTGYFNYDFGKNYIRNVGVNNTADGTINGTYNGTGNAFPASGTGQIYYTQIGFRQVVNSKNHALVPFASFQLGDFDKLADNMVTYNWGISYLFNDHKNKLTLGLQSRPIFDSSTSDVLKSIDRLNMYVLQYQIKL